MTAATPGDRPAVQPFDFVGASGVGLSGRLHLPPDKAIGSVLLAHCFTCSKDLHTMTRLARALTEAGYATLRFDFTGLGDSSGDFAETSVSSNVGDLRRAALALIQAGFGPCALIGHSLGGAAVLLAAAQLKTVESVTVIGAPARAAHVRHLFAGRESDIVEHGRAEVSIGGRPFHLGRTFVEDLDTHDVLEATANLNRPLLIITPGDDRTVDPDQGRELFDAAREPRRRVIIDEADHLLSKPAHAKAAAAEIVAFLNEQR